MDEPFPEETYYYRPEGRLGSEVDLLVGYDEDDPPARVKYPTPEWQLVLSAGTSIRLEGPEEEVEQRSFVAGLHDGPTRTEAVDAWAGVQVSVGPLTAYRLLGVPLHELRNHCRAFDDLAGPAVVDIEETLRSTPDWGTRLRRADAFLEGRLSDGPTVPPEMRWAVGQLGRMRGQIPIGDLRDELQWSRKRLVARFRRFVGMPPKRYARLLRFEHTREQLEAGRDFTETALECGFSDQAHMSREIKSFTRRTPSELAD